MLQEDGSEAALFEVAGGQHHEIDDRADCISSPVVPVAPTVPQDLAVVVRIDSDERSADAQVRFAGSVGVAIGDRLFSVR
jgi:hypothetical protein